MKLRWRAFAATTAATFVVCGLSGCSLLLIPQVAPPRPFTGSLPLDAGDILARDEWTIAWGDDLERERGFTPVDSYHGGGTAFESRDDGCTVTMWETMLTDSAKDRDDATLSDLLLGMEARMRSVEVEEYAFTEMLVVGAGDAEEGFGDIDFRALWYGDDESSYVIAARAVSSLDMGLVLAVDCDAGDETALDFFDLVSDDLLTVSIESMGYPAP